MLRKIVAAIILVPVALIIIAFAVANRQIVTVSFDPFNTEHPAASVAMPLFALVIVLLIGGVVIGGVAAWLEQSGWRRRARRVEREAGALRGEIAAHKRAAGTTVSVPQAGKPPERLQLKPPAA